MAYDQSLIRNFAIIAHIDHGKSTLADRILEATGAIQDRERKDQLLDRLELERERGITIKAQTVRLSYKADDGKTYEFNLIDTPGHVDFSYEVSRSLQACEGALLVVDAAQGVEAQTLANVYLAVDQDLEIVPVINKIDLPAAEPERVKQEIEDIIGIDASEAILTSAKAGVGIHELLEAIVARIPPPSGDSSAPTKALIFDSWFDSYLGAVAQVRVFDGKIELGDTVSLMAAGKKHEVHSMGVFAPFNKAVKSLQAGEAGYFSAAIKSIGDARVGDTVTLLDNPATAALPGFRDAKPMVFSGIYPVDSDDYEKLKDAMEKLRVNDASFVFEPETSRALGFGFRCGFLGLLHMEIIQERLEREYDVDLINTAPTVSYRLHTVKGEDIITSNPAEWPDAGQMEKIYEPVVRATVHVPQEYVGAVMSLCVSRRGRQEALQYPTPQRAVMTYTIPLSEIVLDFYDKLKSATRGYASLDYEFADDEPADLVKMDILINGDVVDSLSVIVHREGAYYRGRDIIAKLKKEIPRQQFEIAIQAAIGSRVIARESVRALRKNVTAKCYGGDITRKRKLLEKQKEGKKRMKQVGSVEVPQEAFLSVLKTGD